MLIDLYFQRSTLENRISRKCSEHLMQKHTHHTTFLLIIKKKMNTGIVVCTGDKKNLKGLKKLKMTQGSFWSLGTSF